MKKIDESREKRISSRMQRIEVLLNDQKIDRVPLWCMMEGFCSKTVGYSINSFYTDLEKSFWSQVWTYEMYGLDEDPRWMYGASGAWEFGGEIKFPTGEWMQAPAVVRNPVQSEEDVWKLEAPDIKASGAIPFSMEFANLQKKFGMFIQPHIGDPFLMAGNVCAPENLLRWVGKRPKAVHRLMRVVTDFLLQVLEYWVDTFGSEHILPWMPSSTSSNYLISARDFEEFVFPYMKEITEKGLNMGIKHFHCHICGNHNDNLSLLAQVPRGNPGIITFGPEVDLADAIRFFGDTCIIGGNVSPALIQTGSPQEVYEAARQCIEKGKRAPRGFVLMSGCDTPPMAPPYNVYVLSKAVEVFGRYE